MACAASPSRVKVAEGCDHEGSGCGRVVRRHLKTLVHRERSLGISGSQVEKRERISEGLPGRVEVSGGRSSGTRRTMLSWVEARRGYVTAQGS